MNERSHRIRFVGLGLGLALGLSLPACVDDDGVHLATREDAITHGTPASAGQFPTVVAILNTGLCTGTLVAPDIVLTAAHCVSPATLQLANQAAVTSHTTVRLDDLALQSGGTGRNIAAANTMFVSTFNEPGDPDIGLIFLSEQVTDRAPATINMDRVAFGTKNIDIVGYGETETGSYGTLLYATNRPQTGCAQYGVNGGNFICEDMRSGAGICSGDSGGPAFASFDGQQRVVGITSFGDTSCTQLGAHFRTDSAAARAYLQANAPQLLCRADGACDTACTDASPDPDCVPACTGPADCGDDEVCGTDGTCQPAPFTPGGAGSVCGSGDDCASGMCAASGDVQVCVDSCDPNAADACGDGFACTTTGSTAVCWPSDGAGGVDGGCSAGGG
ncbi:MAG: trypsin-like serine protease, partial [Kofleriaceae bacterium]|nr:trypsin-like serine protease [Kofleriaceae bacterium]